MSYAPTLGGALTDRPFGPRGPEFCRRRDRSKGTDDENLAAAPRARRSARRLRNRAGRV